MMDLHCSNAVRVYITMSFVIFCCGFVYGVESPNIYVVNHGDNITLTCYPPIYDYNGGYYPDVYCWYKDRTAVACGSRLDENNVFLPRTSNYQAIYNQSFIYDHSSYNSQYNLSFSQANYYNSAIYQCLYGYSDLLYTSGEQYDLRVIGCTCTLDPVDLVNMTNKKVVCELLNTAVPLNLPTETRIIMVTTNRGREIAAVIKGKDISFSIRRSKLRSNLNFEINPYDNAIGNVRCTVPPLVTSPQPSIDDRPTNTVPGQTTQYRRSASSTATSTDSEDSTSGETTKYLTPSNKIPNIDNDTRNGNITLIIAIVGSVCILILIVIVFFLCRKSRPKTKHNGNITPNKDEQSPEVCYESVEDGMQKGPELAASIEPVGKTVKVKENVDGLHNGEMVDNILYDSSDRIAENSISRMEGPLDNALYAMPDKRATINRESKARTVDASCDLDALYGNNDIVSQHEISKDTYQRADQYEIVEMPGSGTDAEEMQLYDMPDKA